MNKLLSLLFTIYAFQLFGQVQGPAQLGLVCDSAVAICSINSLDGFHGVLPADNSFPTVQPAKLCASGGTINNIYWFSFVAGSDSISLTITPFNCLDSTGIAPGNSGIQAGVFTSCDFDSEIICAIGAGMLEPINLASSGFIPGQTYYFWIDGYGGDICEFNVDVNYAEQPFSLPDFTTFDQGNQTDTTCTGFNDYTIGVINYPFDVKFIWDITCTNPSFTPMHLENSLKELNLKFNFDGTYTVNFRATNVCDTTNVLTKQIVVSQKANEVFDTVYVCTNKFPYAGPQDLDPNGDGLFGWFGPNISAPGTSVYNVVQSNGCKYVQTVQVVDLPLNLRKKVTLVDCEPFDYYGNLIWTDVLNLPVTIADGASNGCDSLVSLDAYILDIGGSLSYGNCNNSSLTIKFTQAYINAPTGYSINYKWRWADNTAIPDNDSDPTDITVDKNGEVYLTIDLTYNGKTCSFDIPFINVDLNNLRPDTPTPIDWSLELCADNRIGDYEVANINNATAYDWTIPSGAIILSGENSNHVKIDFTNASSFDLCVSAINECGKGNPTCLPITIIPIPSADFSLPTISCTDSLLVLKINNFVAGLNYQWNIGNNQLISGDLSKSAPITIRLSEGNQTISLAVSDRGCSSSTSHTIEVYKNLETPILDCHPEADHIDFTWSQVACAKAYKCYVNNFLVATTNQANFTVNNLSLNENVDFRVELESDCPCASAFAETSCITLGCDYVFIQTNANKYVICQSDWSTPISLNAMVNGNITQGSQSWIGNGIVGNDFLPELAGLGTHTLTFNYNELGCTFKDSLTITVVPNPAMVLDSKDPTCKEDDFGSLSIQVSSTNQEISYYMDDEKVSSFINQIPIGNHIIKVIDGNNCAEEKMLTINPPQYPEFELSGDLEIFDNQNSNFTIHVLPSEQNLIDSISWYVNGELLCTGAKCYSLNLPPMPEGFYMHEVIVYYKDCEIIDEYMLRVKEAPKVYTSNVFSPNGDGQNDFWEILVNKDYVHIEECSIYSRWGELLFKKSNFSPSEDSHVWDGTFNGSYLNPGVYVYKLSYYNENNNIVNLYGDITLIK